MVTKIELFVAIVLFGFLTKEVYLSVNMIKEGTLQFVNISEVMNKTVNLQEVKIKELSDTRTVNTFYDLIVLILSSEWEERAMLRYTWANETFWAERGLHVKILFIVGANSDYTASERDLLIVDIEETRQNLIYKVVAGLRIIQRRYAGQFEYVLKTDTDVINNLGLWVKRITDLNHNRTIESNKAQTRTKSKTTLDNIGTTAKWQELYLQGIVLYGGIYCQYRAAGYSWCSGMGYMLHTEVIDLITHYPNSNYEGAEDRTVGKIMIDNGIVTNVNIMTKDRLGYRQVLDYACINSTQDWRDTGCLHFGYNGNEKSHKAHLYDCWWTIDFSGDLNT